MSGHWIRCPGHDGFRFVYDDNDPMDIIETKIYRFTSQPKGDEAMALNIGKILTKSGGGKISKAAAPAPGKAGGLIQKAVAGRMGHSKAPTQDVSTDRGAFKIKG